VTELERLYVRFMFDLIGSENGGHLHFGLFTGLPRDSSGLRRAQDQYAERVIRGIARGQRVLDVGCGRGGIARLLAARGVHVTAISPEPDHIRDLSDLDARCTRFEDLAPDGSYDVVLFAESFAFFAWGSDGAQMAGATLDRSRAHLRKGGRCVIADLIEPHVARAIDDHAAFRCSERDDVTEDVTPTIDVLEDRLVRQALPFQKLVRDVIGAIDPPLAAHIDGALAQVDNQALRALFAGRLAERERLAAARYYIYELEAK
jgi:SAM-dependent methyltransferase